MGANSPSEFNFRLLENEDIYQTLLNRTLGSLECKHVVSLSAIKIYRLSLHVGYDWVVFGSHRKGSLESEKLIIDHMANDNRFNRPMRVVYGPDGRLWADNTHTCMAYMKRYGSDTKLKEVPFYVVDVREDIPSVISFNGSVNSSLEDISQAVECSLQIKGRIVNGIRPAELGWTIKDMSEEFDRLCDSFDVSNVLIRSFYTMPICERIESQYSLKDIDQL